MVLKKLAPGGIFITQSGPAGFLSSGEVFSSIHATVRSVFPAVVPYAQHIPSFCDVWGYNMAFSDPAQVGRGTGAGRGEGAVGAGAGAGVSKIPVPVGGNGARRVSAAAGAGAWELPYRASWWSWLWSAWAHAGEHLGMGSARVRGPAPLDMPGKDVDGGDVGLHSGHRVGRRRTDSLSPCVCRSYPRQPGHQLSRL